MATKGFIQPSPPITLTDHTGASYTSSSTINLRWYYNNGTQTFPEKFYIVDKVPSTIDASLRCTAESPSSALVPQVHPHFSSGKDPEDRDRKERKERDEEKYQADRKAQADKIRNAFALKHAVPKHG